MRTAFLLPVITISLRLCGFRATRRWLQRLLPTTRSPLQDAEVGVEAALISRMVLAAARHSPFGITCLERSLALWWLLAKRGVASQLRIGVRKSGDKFEAHAWVEQDGVAIGEPGATHLHYTAFAEEFAEERS